MVNFVVPYDSNWETAFAREAELIRNHIGDTVLELHHVGSTAIPEAVAKPIIDILGVTDSLGRLDDKNDLFHQLGYECLGEYGIAGRRYFRKCGNRGERTHHAHFFSLGSHHIDRHLAFRDFLRTHPREVREYSALKLRLLEENGDCWDAYVDGKSSFIKTTEAGALEWFQRDER